MNNTYADLFLGYSVIWLIVLIFIVKLAMSINKLGRRIDNLCIENTKRSDTDN
jgi:CcmD family protein